MDSKVISEGYVPQSEIVKGNIVRNFKNVDEVLKSEDERAFEESINKGDVDVVTQDDLKDTFDDKYFTKGDIEKFDANIDALIKKGEDSAISEEEYDFIVKSIAERESLIEKALVVQVGEKQKYYPIFVQKSEVSEEAED